MKDNLKLKQKRVPPPRVLLTARNHTDLTEASLSQRNLSNTRTDSWGSDWTHLATEAGCNSDLSPSNSKYETSSSSSGYSHSSGSSSTRSASSSISSDEWPSAYGNCNSQRSPKAAPSSSIGNYSHRSPLSVMRYFPHLQCSTKLLTAAGMLKILKFQFTQSHASFQFLLSLLFDLPANGTDHKFNDVVL
jgi:hypothetical protein